MRAQAPTICPRCGTIHHPDYACPEYRPTPCYCGSRGYLEHQPDNADCPRSKAVKRALAVLNGMATSLRLSDR